MEDVGKDFAVVMDNQPWTREVAPIYKYPSVSYISGGYRSQGVMLGNMPIAQALVVRANWALSRAAKTRDMVMRRLKT